MKKSFFLLLGMLLIYSSMLSAQKEIADADTTFPVIFLGEQLTNDTFFTGINGYFVLSFANDSIIQARFLQIDQYQCYQEIPYRRKGDTIILHNSTQARLPHSVCSSVEAKQLRPQDGIPVIVRFFYPLQPWKKKEIQEHRLNYECIFYMDSTTHQIYIPYGKEYCLYSDIISVCYGNYYHVRLYKDMDISYAESQSEDYLKIDLSKLNSVWRDALFNEFPLLVKGDSIFPIDNEKNYQCWIDNGFFFPIMTKGQDEPWKAKDIPYWRVGLEGTKFEY